MSALIGNIFLAVASLMLVVNGYHGPSAGSLHGHDKMGATVLLMLAGLLRVACIATAVGVIAGKDRFGWFSTHRLNAGLAMVLLFVAVDVIATICSIAGVEARRGPEWVRSSFTTAGLVLSASLLLYLFLTLNGVLVTQRIVHWIVAGGSALLVLAALGWSAKSAIAWQREHAVRVAENEAAQREKDTEYQKDRLAQMEAIPDSAGVGPLLQFLGAMGGPTVHRRVLERAAARPAEVPELLRGKYVIEAMEYLRFDGAPVRAEWAEAVNDAIREIAVYLRKRAGELGDYDQHADTFSRECYLVAEVAERYKSFGVDYKPALREVLAAVDSAPGVQRGQSGRMEIEAIVREKR